MAVAMKNAIFWVALERTNVSEERSASQRASQRALLVTANVVPS
jgi:hypothetical protein